MHLSVIIPTFNRASVLPRALDSVLAQSYRSFEIIVIDDGSTDGTDKLIKKHYPQAHYIKQDHRGVSAARNTGINASHTDWLCFLDSDDSWDSTKLEKQVKELSENTEYRLCHTNETWYRNGTILKQGKKHKKYGGYIFQHCLPLCAISPSSVMIHKQVFKNVGLFDEDLPACEDYDMWLRITCQYPVLFINEALTNKFGGHEDQLSRQHWGMDRFRILALEKSIQSGKLTDADKEAAITMMKSKLNIFLNGTQKHGNNEYSVHFQSLLEDYA